MHCSSMQYSGTQVIFCKSVTVSLQIAAVADAFLRKKTAQASIHETISPYLPSRSPSPLMRPAYAAAFSPSSSSDTSPRDSVMLSGAQQPSIHRIQQLMEDYFSSDTNSSDAGTRNLSASVFSLLTFLLWRQRIAASYSKMDIGIYI